MSLFKFKHFNVNQLHVPQKVGTDAMVLGALVRGNFPNEILDVGTGCGVIALMLAQKFPHGKVTGIDIDKQAVVQAQENFDAANFPNHFDALHKNYLTYRPSVQFDLIVSNPPYFNSKMPSADQQRSLARHEDSMSVQELINHSANLLSQEGELWLIVPAERTESLILNHLQLNLHFTQRIKIFGKPNRHVRDVLTFSKKKIKAMSESTFTIRDEEGKYTEIYKNVTKEFHYNTL